MNSAVTVIGTIASDPKLITTQSGATLCTFRLASGERRFDRQLQKWVDGETNWYGVTAFRTLGEHAQESFRKGERVIVSGRLRIRKWESSEKSGISVDIEADALGHEIRWGVSKFEKRSTSAEQADSFEAISTLHDEALPATSTEEFIPEGFDDEASAFEQNREAA